MQTFRQAVVPLLLSLLASLPANATARKKGHTVGLGAARRATYTPPDATPATKPELTVQLRIRPLIVDDKRREWTVGELHDVTDRSFVVRRALRINDALPGEPARWIWQPGPWLEVDRTTGHVTVLHLPAFDNDISQATWFRDYAAYCGVATTAKGGLVAIVTELGARKPVVQQVLGPWPQPDAPHPVCATPKWQRSPMRATLQRTGGEPVTFAITGSGAGSVSEVDADDSAP
jgi:hypothetical protein